MSLLSSCYNVPSNIEVAELHSELFLNDSVLQAPTTLCLADDYLLICNMDADTIIDVFDLQGNRIKRFLPKGQGPEEGLFVVHLQYDKLNDRIYAPDLHKNSLLCFSNIQDNVLVEEVFKYFCEPNDSIYLHNWYGKLSNGDIIAGNASGGGMLSRFTSDGKFVGFYEKYPDKDIIDERLNDWANGSLYVPIASVSPNGDKIAFVYDNADILTIAKLDGRGHFETKSIRKALPNGIQAVQFGEKVVAGAITSETIIYYQSIATSEKYIYALYINKPYEEIKATGGYKSTVVKVFDWDGDLCRELYLDKAVKDIKVTSEDDCLYGIEESDEGYKVLKYEL